MNTPTTPTLPPRSEREALVLTRDDACDAISDDLPGYSLVKDTIIENSRWAILHSAIIKRESDGRFFADGYRVGATEEQDERPWQYDAPDFREVFPVECVVIEYK